MTNDRDEKVRRIVHANWTAAEHEIDAERLARQRASKRAEMVELHGALDALARVAHEEEE